MRKRRPDAPLRRDAGRSGRGSPLVRNVRRRGPRAGFARGPHPSLAPARRRSGRVGARRAIRGWASCSPTLRCTPLAGGGRPADRLHQRKPRRRADGHCDRRRRGSLRRGTSPTRCSRTIDRSSDRWTIPWRGSTPKDCRCFAAHGDMPRCRSPWTSAGPTILAVGGHLKNTVALAIGGDPLRVVLSPHIGDLDSPLSVDVFRRAIDDLVEFFQARPEAVACDLHPDYASTRMAEELAARWDAPLRARAAPSRPRRRLHGGASARRAGVGALLGRHRLRRRRHDLGRRGPGVPRRRSSSASPICGHSPCPAATWPCANRGGRPWVCSTRFSATPPPNKCRRENTGRASATRDSFTSREMKTLFAAMARSVNSPRTSSMGRLFDAVAALVRAAAGHQLRGPGGHGAGIRRRRNGERRLSLAAACPARRLVADWEPMIAAVLADRAAAASRLGRISARFHNALAELALTMARRPGATQVVLTRRLFSERPVDRPGPAAFVGGGLFGVYSSAGPARRRRHCPGANLRRRPTNAKDRFACAWEFPVKWSKRICRTTCPWARSSSAASQGDLPGLHARGRSGRLRDRPRRLCHQPRGRDRSRGDLLLSRSRSAKREGRSRDPNPKVQPE